MTRRFIAALTLALLGGLLAFDIAASDPLNPFRAPPLLALGSGSAASGAHCASLPPAE
ncbi:hypothetical protein [Sagittula salina]|uniref:Uncharacterized protein n=1 Tax=Sagittula salina TaxID=2820268 RepID=A0A940S4I9_9RHOB|nr:hypothetical protein [Sagittula salina]MBP0484159.1 hypothetical protein [Sagittula salina]